MNDSIAGIFAYEILSGSGKPTVEVEMKTDRGISVVASVPSGTSTGGYEAFEVVDGGSRYRGRGARTVAETINSVIAPHISGQSLSDPVLIDELLRELDGTPDKSRLGGNALLAVSAAAYKAAAASSGLPVYQFLGGIHSRTLPVPIATVIAGGKHSLSPELDFEDYICIFHDFSTFHDALEALSETRAVLQEQLTKRFGAVPDTGGALSPPLKTTSEAIESILKAVDSCGYSGKISLGLDVAANEFYEGENGYRIGDEIFNSERLMDYYEGLLKTYPIIFVEDPFQEDDFLSFSTFTKRFPKIFTVGDDLFASNPQRLRKGIQKQAANSILLKINQAGTVSEACQSASLAVQNGYSVIVSLRSNETNDPFIADLAVGTQAKMIKLGSPVRGERVAKYNRLLRIEHELNRTGRFLGFRTT